MASAHKVAAVLLALVGWSAAGAASFEVLETRNGAPPPEPAEVLAGRYDAEFRAFDGRETHVRRGRVESWYRIQLEPRDDAPLRVLSVRRLPLDSLELHAPNGAGGWRTLARGMRHDAMTDFHACCFVFDLPADLGAGSALYLHARDRSSLPLVLAVEPYPQMAARDVGEAVLIASVLAIIFSMLLVNGVFYAVLRDAVYLYFALFLLFSLAWIAHAVLPLSQLPLVRMLRPDAMFPWTLLAAGSAFFATGFMQRFVELRAHAPHLDRTIDVGRWLVIALALATAFETAVYGTLLRDAFGASIAALAMLSLVAGAISLRHAPRAALFVLVGWGILLLLTAYGALAALGVAPLDRFAFYAPQAGVALQAVVLTIGLADQTFEFRRQRDRAQSGRDQALAKLTREQARRALGDSLAQLSNHGSADLPFTAFKRVLAALGKVMPISASAALIEGLGDHRVLVADPASTQEHFNDLVKRRAATLHSVGQSPRQLMLGAEPDALNGHKVDSIAVVPLRFSGSTWGVLLLERPSWQDFSAEDLELAADYGALAVREIETQRAQVVLQQQASFDALTGALNRGNIETMLENQFEQAVLSRQPFSVLFIDLDHFKRVNDEHGHPVGDECLVRVCQRILHVIKHQALGRYGGEEFLVLLPQIDAERAKRIAEEICASVRDRPIACESQQIPLTVSIGGASRQPGELTSRLLLDRADQALYLAKRSGRDRTVWADSLSAQTA